MPVADPFDWMVKPEMEFRDVHSVRCFVLPKPMLKAGRRRLSYIMPQLDVPSSLPGRKHRASKNTAVAALGELRLTPGEVYKYAGVNRKSDADSVGSQRPVPQHFHTPTQTTAVPDPLERPSSRKLDDRRVGSTSCLLATEGQLSRPPTRGRPTSSTPCLFPADGGDTSDGGASWWVADWPASPQGNGIHNGRGACVDFDGDGEAEAHRQGRKRPPAHRGSDASICVERPVTAPSSCLMAATSGNREGLRKGSLSQRPRTRPNAFPTLL